VIRPGGATCLVRVLSDTSFRHTEHLSRLSAMWLLTRDSDFGRSIDVTIVLFAMSAALVIIFRVLSQRRRQ
jgi:hypothetical protein